MDIEQANKAAIQILDEERLYPTLKYEPKLEAAIDSAAFVPNGLIALANSLTLVRLPNLREERPRKLQEKPQGFKFESRNHDMLRALYSQLSTVDRTAFLLTLKRRLISGVGCTRSDSLVFPRWNRLISELPLIIEFMVRNGAKPELVETLSDTSVTLIPGHVLMLLQLEDLIALNYTVFTSDDYTQLSTALQNFENKAVEKYAEYRKKNVQMRYPEIGIVNPTSMYLELWRGSERIKELARKAQYLYLKGVLLEGQNLEVNQDKVEVESYLKQFGFSQLLIDSLNAAENLYQQGSNTFDFKNCVGHLRSFLEHVHREAIAKLPNDKKLDAPEPAWGSELTFLFKKGVLSKKEEQFIAALYTLISDEAVHPLAAEREYARLARNFVIEYALLLFTKLKKLGMNTVAS